MYQANLARERFELTRTLANRFLFDFHKEIANLPGSTSAQQMVINTAVEYLDKLGRTAGSDPVMLEDMAQAYVKLAAVQGGGMTLMAARFKDALVSQQHAVDLQRRLAAINPLKRRMLARGLLDQANIELRLAQNAAGLEHAQEAARILEDVAKGPEGSDHKLWNEQASAYLYVARMLKRTGRPAEALAANARSRERIEAVLAVDPSMPMVYRQSIVLEDEGTLRVESGDVEKGVALLEEAMRKAQKVIDSDPNNRVYKRFLFVLMGGLAEAYSSYEIVSAGDPAKALAVHEKRSPLAQSLADSDRADGGARMDLAVARMEHILPLSTVDPKRAIAIGESAIAIWDDVLKASPGDVFATSRRARGMTRLAMILLRSGQLPAAIAHSTEAAATLQRIVEARPKEYFFEMSAIFALVTAADSLAAANRMNEAEDHYRKAVTIANGMLQRSPKPLTFTVVSTYAFDHFGDYWRHKRNDSAQARQWYERSVAEWTTRPESTSAVERYKQFAQSKMKL
jgi:tetratricopeptide (TPR) repeat protein